MRYDDDAIERALAALPLEEVPSDLRARILGATIRRPAPILRPWELTVVGIAAAVATWFVLMLIGSPLTGGAAVASQIGATIDASVRSVSAALNLTTCLWLAIGFSAAIWLSLVPVRDRDGVEA